MIALLHTVVLPLTVSKNGIGGTDPGARFDPICVGVVGAAQLLGIGKNAVRQLVKEGRLPALKFGSRRLVIPVDAIRALVAKESQTEEEG